MNNFQKNSLRNKAILSTINRLGALDACQIRLLFFPGLSQNELICQRTLKKMYDRKLLKRSRITGNEPYFYYTEKPKQIEHRLGVNWIYVWQSLKYRKIPDYRISYVQHEDTYETLRADALMIIQNTFKKVNIINFNEFDIAESGNDFDKITLYNDLYEKNEIASRPWHKLATGFPSVIIVTTGSKQRIMDHMSENRNELDFQVYTLDEVKGECLYERNHAADSSKVSVGR